MPRRPKIGNVQLYPNRPLRESDRNGYVLKFYCPLKRQRIRKNSGTRDRTETRRILRGCRERLLNGQYVESGGAIKIGLEQATVRSRLSATLAPDAAAVTWQECFDDYYRHRKQRGP